MGRRLPPGWLSEPRFREHQFFICVRCAELFQRGRAQDLPQRCPCRENESDPKWPGYTFNSEAELCCCCGQELVPSWSKYMHLHCRECLGRIRALHERLGGTVIPMGIHSFVNGVFLAGWTIAAANEGSPQAQVDVERLANALWSLSERIDRMRERRKTVLRHNLDALASSKRSVIHLPQYLEAIRSADGPAFTKEAAFRGLCEHFGIPLSSSNQARAPERRVKRT